MGIFQSSDESCSRLKRAGWSRARSKGQGVYWLVTGANGENVIEARGGRQAEAWHCASEQAKHLGMLRR